MLNKVRLLTPGPTPLPERVRLVLAKDMIHHRKSEFKAMMGRVQERLRVLFGTADVVLPLSCSGTGAMTAAVYSLFSPGQRVLVVEGGKFGQRWREIAVSRGLETTTIEVPWGEAVDPQAVAAANPNTRPRSRPAGHRLPAPACWSQRCRGNRGRG